MGSRRYLHLGLPRIRRVTRHLSFISQALQ
jgi:hypothetical protein